MSVNLVIMEDAIIYASILQGPMSVNVRLDTLFHRIDTPVSVWVAQIVYKLFPNTNVTSLKPTTEAMYAIS